MQQEIRFCTSNDGTRIAFATSGDGPPFVKAANFLSHLEFDWDSPVWRHWLHGLGRHHTLVRYDERGNGLSDHDVETLNVDAWVHDLEKVVDTLGLERFPLLGISQGGPVAITYAVRHPERVSHLILFGTYACGRFNRDLPPKKLEEHKTLLKLMELGWGQDNPAFRQVFTTMFVPDGTLEQMHWFNELQRISTSPENAVRLETAFFNINARDLLPQIRVPTLVLHVRNDYVVSFEEGRILAAEIPGARFVPLEGNNHILLEHEPAWERFLSEVHHFVGIEDRVPVVPRNDALLNELTKRELEVLDLLAQGRRNAEIADQLFLSPKTIRNYLSNIFSKLHVEDRAQAIIIARERGLGRSE